jgi:hypothetical protein
LFESYGMSLIWEDAETGEMSGSRWAVGSEYTKGHFIMHRSKEYVNELPSKGYRIRQLGAMMFARSLHWIGAAMCGRRFLQSYDEWDPGRRTSTVGVSHVSHILDAVYRQFSLSVYKLFLLFSYVQSAIFYLSSFLLDFP